MSELINEQDNDDFTGVQFESLARLAEYDNHLFASGKKQGRPECALECNDYSVRRAATCWNTWHRESG